MKETLFELNDGTYAHQGDYLLPDIKLPEQSEFEIAADSFTSSTTELGITMR